MEEGEDISFEKLDSLEEEKVEIDSEAFNVNDGICRECGGKLVKFVDNKNLLNGTITFHIIKLKCPNCNREYLDLEQAEKYDFLLLLEKAVRQPLNKLSQKIVS